MSPKCLGRCGTLSLQEGVELEGFSGRLKKRRRESHSRSQPMLDRVTEMGSFWHTSQEGWCNTNTATCSWSKNIQPCASHLWLSAVRDRNYQGGEFPAGTCSSWPGGHLMAKHFTRMGSCSNVGGWNQDLSLWAETQGYSRSSKQLLQSLPFLLSHPKDRAVARARALASCSGLRSSGRTKTWGSWEDALQLWVCLRQRAAVVQPPPARSKLKTHYSVGKKKSAVLPKWNEDEGQGSAEYFHPQFCLSRSCFFITYF